MKEKEYEIAPFQWGTADRLTGWILEQRSKKYISGSSAARSADGSVLAVTYQFTDGRQQLIVTQTKGEQISRRTITCKPEIAEKLKLLGIIPSEPVN